MTSRYWAIWTLVIALGCRAAVAEEGYAIQGDRIVTQGADQWRQWIFPFGTVDIDSEGARPHFVASELNACLNAHRFPPRGRRGRKGRGDPSRWIGAGRGSAHPRRQCRYLLGARPRRSTGSVVGGD